MKKIEKQFADVCSTYGTGLKHLKRTIAVYEALKQEKEAVRPNELGKHMGLYSYNQVIHPLHWLEAIGLVRREEHEETIKIWDGYLGGHFETVTVTIDGLTYTAKKWVKNDKFIEKVVKYYKWFAV